ncbi:MAG: D-alanine--D-alanine ligase [Ignavibacteriales bacterium CG_4_9_14_3_um_filter_30_11]|nr:MAG: D-alanine--D-alanine ligase [Ignavibacteriales bacterium CG_4_9_14_3_um_filter_30_11]
MKQNKKILVAYNAPVSIYSIYTGKPGSFTNGKHDLSENGFSNEIENICTSLRKHYYCVEVLAIDNNIESAIKNIVKFNPDVIFNFVESVEGISSYEFCIAGVYELLGYQYTGNRPQTLGNCLNKSITKNILKAFNIDTPSSITLSKIDELNKNDFTLNFPVIIKLLKEDASIGISENSVVYNFKSLLKQVDFLLNTYKTEIIIEEYIDGKELNVAILGNSIFPISEISFKGLPKGLPKIVTYESKWITNSDYYNNTLSVCPAKINNKLKNLVEDIATKSFKALKCRDYARVDIRLGKNNKPYVIEINPNPDISVDSGFYKAAKKFGLSHDQLLKKLSEFALSRSLNDTQNKAV